MGKHRKRGSGEGTVYQRADGLWTAQLTVGTNPLTGKPIRKTVYGNTQREVLEKLDKLKEDATNGLLMTSDWTVWTVLDSWLTTQKASISPASHERYEIDLSYLKPYTTRTPLAQLFPLTVTLLYQAMEKDGLTTNQRFRAGLRLRQALDYAVRLGMIRSNPARLIRTPRPTAKEIHPLTADEARHLVSSSRQDRLHALWVVALDSGARRGELLALEWDRWNEEENTISITKSLGRKKGKTEIRVPKTKKSRRVIPLSEASRTALREHRERMQKKGKNSQWIFCTTKGTYIQPHNMDANYFKPTLRRVGLPETTRFHDLRHTCATLLLQKGVNVKVVSERLGHASVVITLNTYAHVMPGMQAEAARIMGDILTPGS